MKKLIAFLGVMLLLGATFASGDQLEDKKFELGTSVSLWLLSEEGESGGFLTVPVRFGWFAWKGLEIEPEVTLMFPLGEMADEGIDTSYQLLGNVVYNFQTSGKAVPFIGGGVGFGNAIPMWGGLIGDADLSTFIFDGMAGVKFFLTEYAALRIEYRFSRYALKVEGFDTEHVTIHQGFVGLSVFF